jgi:hypothetical protein
MRDWELDGTTKETQLIASRICKMIRIAEEVRYVSKIVKRHQNNASLKTLTMPIQFIRLDGYHAELTILK